MSPRRDLRRSLAQTLRVKAQGVSVTVRPFDAEREPSTALEDDPPTVEPARRSQGLLRSAAVVVGVVALVGSVVAVRAGDGDRPDRTRTGRATTTTRIDDAEPAAPDGLLIPTWVPDGLELWDVEWRTSENGGTRGQVFQLFGEPGAGPAILVMLLSESEVGSAFGSPGGWGTAVTVRGTSGVTGPDTHPGAHGATVVEWRENGAAISVSFRGMAADQALATLGRLTWRSTDYRQGFAAPADGSLPLRGRVHPASSGTTHALHLLYGEGPSGGVGSGRGRTVEISTGTAPTGAETSEAYLRLWFYGDRNPDGTVHWFDPTQGLVNLAWPDGRTVDVTTVGETDPAIAERVAGSVRAGTTRDAHRLRAEADANVVALPVLGSYDGRAATLTVHDGDGYAAYELCIRFPARSDDEPDCGLRGTQNPLGPPPALDGSVVVSTLVDGTWYVGMASPTTPPEVTPAPYPGSPEPQPYPGEAGRDGDWRFLLVEIPPDIDRVSVSPQVMANVERPR